MPAERQKKAAYIARCYGAQLDSSEILGATWTGITDRLTPEYLSKHSGVTLETIAFRAAHAAAEVWRYDRDKLSGNAPLEGWNGVGGEDVERSTIIRTAIKDCFARLDSRGKAIAKLILEGYTERQAGEAVGISGPAVHKRLVQIRRMLQEVIG